MIRTRKKNNRNIENKVCTKSPRPFRKNKYDDEEMPEDETQFEDLQQGLFEDLQKGSILKSNNAGKLIDYELLARLCHIQCTSQECCAVLAIDFPVLDKRMRSEIGRGFYDFWNEYSQGGKKALRRRQFEIALRGSVSMLIWLGKQYLGQAEKHEVTGAHGGPMQVQRASDLSTLTDAELALAERMGVYIDQKHMTLEKAKEQVQAFLTGQPEKRDGEIILSKYDRELGHGVGKGKVVFGKRKSLFNPDTKK